MCAAFQKSTRILNRQGKMKLFMGGEKCCNDALKMCWLFISADLQSPQGTASQAGEFQSSELRKKGRKRRNKP